MVAEFQRVCLTAQDQAISHSPWPALNRLNGLATLPVVGAPILIGLALSAAGQGSTAAVIAAVIAAACVLTWWGVCLAASRSAARLYASTPVGAAPLDWRFDDTGLVQSSSAIRSETPWDSVVEVKEEVDRFLFLLTPYTTLALPKRFGRDEDVQALRGLVEAARRDGRIKGVSSSPQA